MERCIVELNLNAVLEISKNGAVQIHTGQTLAESAVLVGAVLIGQGIFGYYLSAYLGAGGVICYLASVLDILC